MDDRSRQRSGRQASIAGDAADRVIESLVKQFDDPHAFVRELIQNSLDAGAVRIDVEMSYANGTLTIAVRDDGEGMDRATIEGYLLVKFRSTKEQDLTKIGKFGIGFVSLFAMKPRTAYVDTGRDGVWHRVVFAQDLSYTLMRMDDPYEGTTVTLEIPCSARDAGDIARKVRDRAERWCRHVPHDIRTSAIGIPDGWGTTPIRAPFTLDAPVTLRLEGDGFTAVLGVAAAPTAGFYSRGLTLLEEQGAPYVPGVSFKLDDGRLEHTLTRDNVIRDASFESRIAELLAAARGPLADAVHAEAEAAARARDLPRLGRFWSAIAPDVAWTWRNDSPLLPIVGGDPIPLRRVLGLTGGWLTWVDVAVGTDDDPLARAVVAAGTPVVLGAPDDPHVAFLARLGVRAIPVGASWKVAVAAERPEAVALLAATAAILDHPVAAATLHGRTLQDRLAYESRDPFVPAPASARTQGTIVVAVDHALVAELLALPPDLAAPILARAVTVDIGRNDVTAETCARLGRQRSEASA